MFPVIRFRDNPVCCRLYPYLRPYVTIAPRYDSLEVVPTVEGSSVWLTLANRSMEPYAGTIRFDPTAIGFRSAGSISVKNAKTGHPIPATRSSNGEIQWRVDLPPAGFQVVQLSLSKSATM